MIPTTLAPGTEIECIDDTRRGVDINLIRGTVYTVRGYALCPSGYVSVLLNETSAHIVQNGKVSEVGFYRDRFRVIVVHESFICLIERANRLELEPVE